MSVFKLNLNAKTLSPSDVGNIIVDYFDSLETTEEVTSPGNPALGILPSTLERKVTLSPTIAGLAMQLNMTPKRLFTYADVNFESEEKGEQEKSQMISRALAFIAQHYEQGGDIKKNATFNWNMLKALGYPEKTQVDHTINGDSLAELAAKADKLRNSSSQEDSK